METQQQTGQRPFQSLTDHRPRRGKLGLWTRRLEELRATYPKSPQFLESAHRLLRWSAIEDDVDLYVAVRCMIHELAEEPTPGA